MGPMLKRHWPSSMHAAHAHGRYVKRISDKLISAWLVFVGWALEQSYIAINGCRSKKAYADSRMSLM